MNQRTLDKRYGVVKQNNNDIFAELATVTFV